MAVTALQQVLVDSWARRGPLAWALAPLALGYRSLVAIRHGLYRLRIWRAQSVPVPVVVVGNVVAGGAGKTPVVIALVQHLQRAGHCVGVVSRGYGRDSDACLAVTATSTAREVGDEPLLIHRATGASVQVARRRIDAARMLLQRAPQTDVLVCDDGLQHLQLARDIEVCVFDPTGIGNGWLLPAGPLREPWPRPADLVVADGALPAPGAWPVRRTLADHALRADGERIGLHGLGQDPQAPVWALAGIARPEAFFTMLREAGVVPSRTFALPDHAPLDAADVPAAGAHTLVCTEKDAVKLWRLRPDAWAVPLVVHLPQGFWDELDRLLTLRRAAKLSSRHGHTPA